MSPPRYWVYDVERRSAQGPFEIEDIERVPHFSPETIVAPDGAASADAWRPAKTYDDLSVLFIKPPPPVPKSSPTPSTTVPRPTQPVVRADSSPTSALQSKPRSTSPLSPASPASQDRNLPQPSAQGDPRANYNMKLIAATSLLAIGAFAWIVTRSGPNKENVGSQAPAQHNAIPIPPPATRPPEPLQPVRDIHGQDEPALDVNALEPFPVFALEKLQMSFPADTKLIKTVARPSGYFKGLDAMIFGQEGQRFPRSEILTRNGRVYAFEKCLDAKDDKLWTAEIPIPNFEPVPFFVIENLGTVQNLSGYGIHDMGTDKLIVFTAVVKAIVKEARLGAREQAEVGSTTIVYSRNQDELRVSYVPTSTWRMMRLRELAGVRPTARDPVSDAVTARTDGLFHSQPSISAAAAQALQTSRAQDAVEFAQGYSLQGASAALYPTNLYQIGDASKKRWRPLRKLADRFRYEPYRIAWQFTQGYARSRGISGDEAQRAVNAKIQSWHGLDAAYRVDWSAESQGATRFRVEAKVTNTLSLLLEQAFGAPVGAAPNSVESHMFLVDLAAKSMEPVTPEAEADLRPSEANDIE